MKILISGGTGMIGSHLTKALRRKQHQVSILTTQKKLSNREGYIYWNPRADELASEDLEGFDVVVHLAGAGIADKRWTKERKKVIIDSRVKSAHLLLDRLAQCKKQPKQFISSSGSGFYGSHLLDHINEETDEPGSDFLAHCCKLWEEAAAPAKDQGMTLSVIRTGVVLSSEGGALPKLAQPVKLFAGSPLGSGKQYMPWIHIDDLCGIYEHCIEKNLEGTFNAGSDNSVTNKAFVKQLGKALKRPVWLPNVPAFVLNTLLGEMAIVVLAGQRMSAKKIKSTGFNFQFEDLETALNDLLK